MPNLPNFRRQAMGDVVPAMLEPGEFVINRNAVNALGVDNLEVLNDAGGAHGAIDKLIASATLAEAIKKAGPSHYQRGGEVKDSMRWLKDPTRERVYHGLGEGDTEFSASTKLQPYDFSGQLDARKRRLTKDFGGIDEAYEAVWGGKAPEDYRLTVSDEDKYPAFKGELIEGAEADSIWNALKFQGGGFIDKIKGSFVDDRGFFRGEQMEDLSRSSRNGRDYQGMLEKGSYASMVGPEYARSLSETIGAGESMDFEGEKSRFHGVIGMLNDMRLKKELEGQAADFRREYDPQGQSARLGIGSTADVWGDNIRFRRQHGEGSGGDARYKTDWEAGEMPWGGGTYGPGGQTVWGGEDGNLTFEQSERQILEKQSAPYLEKARGALQRRQERPSNIVELLKGVAGYLYGGPVKKNGIPIGSYQEGGVVPESFLEHLESREGSLNLIYKDSLGLPTGGTGHEMSDKDLKKYKVAQYVDYDTDYGTRKVAVDKKGDIIKLDEATTENWRKNDSEKAYMAALKQAKELGIKNQKMINALGSVNFQLGTGWRREGKFPAVWKAMKAGDYGRAAKNVKWVSPSDTSEGVSDWYEDTPKRAEDFMGALESYVPGMQQGGEVEQLEYREPPVQSSGLMGMSNDRRVMPVLPPDEYVIRQENGEMFMSRQQVPKLSTAYMAALGMETPLSKRQKSLLQKRAISPESMGPQMRGLLGKVLLQRLENEPE